MPQPWEMDWSNQSGAAAAPPPETKAPWEMDWTEPAKPSKSFGEKLSERFNNPPNEPSIIGTAGKLWRGITLPGEVAQGKSVADPLTGHTSQDVIERASDLSTIATPMNPAISAGDRAIPGLARNEPLRASESPKIQAATTANDLGAPLPVGLASDNRAVQSITNAARQLPGVGTGIDTKVANTVRAAGEGINTLADTLAGGVVDRAGAGASLRPSLQGTIEANNTKIDKHYDALRNLIDPERPVTLPRTTAALEGILRERAAAGQKNPQAGLEDIQNLATTGASFNGLQRARSDIGNALNFGTANPGFNKGDLKRVYAAMSGDMDSVVKATAWAPAEAQVALKEANKAASQLIGHNQNLQKLLGIKSDEGLVGSVVKAAQDKTGNARLLAQLRASMPKEDFEQIAGTALSELGHSTKTGEFSLNQFTTSWEKLGDHAKRILFSPQHGKYLDDIARLGKHLKGGDQYLNPSGTARAGGLMDALKVGGGGAAAMASQGDPTMLLGLLGSVGGGYVMAKALARPAGAAAIARWSRAVDGYVKKPSSMTKAAVTVTTRDMITNLASIAGVSKDKLLENLREKDAQASPIPQITVRPGHKLINDRVPQRQ